MRKVVVFVSSSQADLVREAIAGAGEGRLGNYTETLCAARYVPGLPRALDEERIEFACDDETYASILSAIDHVSPVYAPTVDSWSLETI
jgi:hypothetical protein